MSNERNPTKKKLQVWVDASLLAQIDGIAARKGLTRAAVVSEALSEYASGAASQPATKADLVALASTLTKAIRDQPIAVQQASAEAGLPAAGDASRAREAERERIAGMGWRERRRYLRGGD